MSLKDTFFVIGYGFEVLIPDEKETIFDVHPDEGVDLHYISYNYSTHSYTHFLTIPNKRITKDNFMKHFQ